MTELERIQDQLRRSFVGPAWHGSAVIEQLTDVQAHEVPVRVMPGCHNIGELVGHMAAWRRLVVHRLKGDFTYKVVQSLDWPESPMDEAAWESLLEDLRQTQRELLAALRTLDPKELDDQVPGSEHTWYGLLHGVLQHDIYHLGQIGLLKKALRSQ